MVFFPIYFSFYSRRRRRRRCCRNMCGIKLKVFTRVYPGAGVTTTGAAPLLLLGGGKGG